MNIHNSMKKTLKLFPHFHYIYFSERMFLTLNVIKNKHCNNLLNLDDTFRLTLTSLRSNIENLASEVQDQGKILFTTNFPFYFHPSIFIL